MARALGSRAEEAMRARASAADAAGTAGCVVEPLTDLDALAEASSVFSSVWTQSATGQVIPYQMLRALTHAGNYAAGAYGDAGMEGAIAGFLGDDAEGIHLHSHIMGVLSSARGRGVGFALKLDQRAWALERGISRIGWTFDPLVRANAHFNLAKLGAMGTAYHRNFYGTMADDINGHDDSDRLVVTWSLESARALAACGGAPVRRAFGGGVIVLEEDAAGRPRGRDRSGSLLLCQVPRDIVDMRRRDPSLARQWRRAVRDTLGAALDDGYVTTGLTSSGSYVLEVGQPP